MKRKTKTILHQIELGNSERSYELVYGSYKNINLRIRSDGSIRVSANRKVPVERIEDFLRSKEPWILRALDRLNEAEDCSASNWKTPWQAGGRIPILGQKRTILVDIGSKACAVLENDFIRVTVPQDEEAEIRRAVRKMMETELMKIISLLYESIEQHFIGYELPKATLRFRYMVSRWGSCCPSQKAVTLNKYLICVPIECIEYVIVHELAHFFELNHSSAFWKTVEAIMPDWRARKQKLTPYGVLLRKL